MADLFLVLSVLPFVVPAAAVLLIWRYLSYHLRRLYFKLVYRNSIGNCKVTVASHSSISESASTIARKIRTGEYTSVECVTASIALVRGVNKYVNAVCNERFKEALKEAKKCDDELQALRDANSEDKIERLFQERPFFGVPCSIKECFALAGSASSSSGLPARANVVPYIDATAVGRLRSSGFIPVCNTNTSEGCMWYESSNPVYGRTNNAYDLGRIVAGSSGGEACLISTGAVACGLGSDIGGSIRMPAAMNGIFGHKPTGGLVPSTGQFPGTPYPFLVTGPLCHHSEDLLPLLMLMAGPDGVDRACTLAPADLRPVKLPAPLLTPKSVASDRATVPATSNSSSANKPLNTISKAHQPINAWNEVTIFRVPWDQLTAHRPAMSTVVQSCMRAAVDTAVKALIDEVGCQGPVVDFPFPEFAEAFDLWSAVLAAAEDNPKFADVMAIGHGREGQQGKGWLAIEALKWCVGMSNSTLPAIGLALIEDLPSAFMPEKQVQLRQRLEALKKRIHSVLSESKGLLIFPGFPTVAPIHDTPLLRITDASFTAIFNVLEVPITVVPIRDMAGSHGMPTCVQIVGARGADRLTIAAAEALEAIHVAGWKPPPLVDVSGVRC